MNDLQSRIKKLSGWAHPTKVHDNFPSYIKKIHFPFFRNLEKGTEITFDFPLTVFVGQNGCGKSSALQALYGCPEGKSGGTYWFNTATDPIPESSDGIPPSVWFEYFNKDAKQDVQILKCRISYKKKTGRVIPDYWEPSRPVTKYGMNPFISGDGPGKLKTRWKGLKKDVLYLDFRAELSAFDKYFYFGSDPHGKKIISKQDFLRRHSKDLQRIFNGSGVITRKIRKKDKWRALNEELIVLPNLEIEAICIILGKVYGTAKLLKHSFYKQEGVSVRFESRRPDNSDLNYTEAYAGSGEMSVVTLVHQVFNAPDNSLILLDEPEVSLHPGAQKRMLRFLLEQIEQKKHQIVLCTHSPALVEELPCSAIKLFVATPEGYFKVYPQCNPLLAFSYIGQTVSSKIKIIVEDEAAKQLIEKIIETCNGWSDLYEVSFHLGGAEDIFKEAVAFSRVGETRRFFLLDGDKKKGTPIELGNIGDSQLDGKIQEVTNIAAGKFQFIANSGNTTKAGITCEKKRFLEYIKKYFQFLPGRFPEDTVILSSSALNKPVWVSVETSGKDSKTAMREWADSKVGSSSSTDISTYRKELLNSIDPGHEYVKEIVLLLKKMQDD